MDKTDSTATPRWQKLLQYFNVANDLEPHKEVEQSIREGISFRGSQLLILIFAILIASLGLNTDSVAVIIGAMLISPLMGPIMGMGLALATGDFELLQKGLKNIGMAILGSVLASALFFLISPQFEDSSQLLARTSPSIYDVFIALFGGAAGIVSTACRNKGQVLPGVAIATSLMPPLCTAGYGLATWQSHFFFGAFYLFFTNMIFILFASWTGLKLMGYHLEQMEMTARNRRVQQIVYFIVFATVGVSAWLTVLMVERSIFIRRATDFVDTQMQFPNTQVLNHKEYISDGERYIDVTLIGQALPKDSLQLAMINRLDSAGLGGTHLNIKQGFAMISPELNVEHDNDNVYALMQSQIATRQHQVDSLRALLSAQTTFSEKGSALTPEIKVIFPSIRDIAMSRIVATSLTGESDRDTVNVVFINSPKGLTADQQSKIKEYISLRLGVQNPHLSINPRDFPWPTKR